jgi:uncharacterized protein YdeI (YjbR/CyaY-like superfamily)
MTILYPNSIWQIGKSSQTGIIIHVEIAETLYVTNRADWRSWLQINNQEKKEIWLVYYKKTTGKPTISYEDAVEEALCFGWIDSIEKTLDNERFAGRFTPRRKGSKWSESNILRLRKLFFEAKMTAAGIAVIPIEILEKVESKRTP